MKRRINDAQVERLLDAMRRDTGYRQELAHRLVEKEDLERGTADYKRRYKSTMRRFQRYITEASERRSFARSPVVYQRQVRHEARHVSPPPLPPPRELEVAPAVEPEVEPYDHRRDLSEYDLSTLEQAVRAYYDGDLDDAADGLGLSDRAKDVLELATQGEGADVQGIRGAGELQDAIAELLETLPDADIEDIRVFHDLLMDLPDWQIGMIIEDLERGATTFSDWMDAYEADDYDIVDVEDSEFWKLWRYAYARATK